MKMTKRLSSTDIDMEAKKVKTTPQDTKDALARIKASIIENDTKIDFGAAKSVIEGLLSPKTIDEFMGVYWEKQPMHVKREQSDYYGTAFTLEALRKIVSGNELSYGDDVDVFRYVKNEKEILNKDEPVTLENIENFLTKEKATIQFHQPQRYTDVLWNILEKLETFFGSLVAANAYITPSQAQGLAPHCDESETLVLQLEGSMEWNIYAPKVTLARDGTHDLNKEVLDEPKLTIELKTGDMLYIPRGYIHESINKTDSSSTRVEISTYMSNTWGDFMSLAVKKAIESALESKEDASFRKGLPVSYGTFLGTGKNLGKYMDIKTPETTTTSMELPRNEKDERVISFKQHIRKRLNNLVDHFDVDVVADSISSEFIAKRLPPFEFAPKSEFTAPTLQDEIILKFKEHVKVMFYAEDEDINATRFGYSTDDELTEDEDTEDEATEDEEMLSEDEKKPVEKETLNGEQQDEDDEDYVGTESTFIKIIHSLQNDRKTHMDESIAHQQPTSLKFPIQFACAITKLVNTTEYITVSELPGLDEETDKLRLAVALYDSDLVEIKPRLSR